MLISDILHSCSNERVAEAAVSSIGGDFAERVTALARRCDLPVGALVGKLVRRFAIDARERDWRGVMVAIAGKDLPVLAGLQAIVETTMRVPSVNIQLATLASEASQDGPVWTVSPTMEIEFLNS